MVRFLPYDGYPYLRLKTRHPIFQYLYPFFGDLGIKRTQPLFSGLLFENKTGIFFYFFSIFSELESKTFHNFNGPKHFIPSTEIRNRL